MSKHPPHLKSPLTLSTEREGLISRQLATEADDKVYFEAVQEDPEHIDNYGNSVASNYDTLEKVRGRRLNAGADIRMGIWDGDEFTGSISARVDAKDNTQAEIGYWLRKDAVGNGYATLATKALTAYVKPKFSRLFAQIHIDNKPSIRVMERSGYVRTGEAEKDWGPAVVFEPAK